jgi:hypothetical protein
VTPRGKTGQLSDASSWLDPCPDDCTVHRFLDGYLAPAEQRGVALHLLRCSACIKLVIAVGRSCSRCGARRPG